MNTRIMGLLVIAALGACRPATVGDSVREPTDKQVKRAEEAADALVQELGGRLMAELGQSGPLGAIEVCSQIAQQIAQDHSRNDLLVRRVSLRFRNPANQASGWATRQLDEWQTELERGKTPEPAASIAQHTGPDGPTSHSREYWYLRPLFVAPPCLHCHGALDEMDPAVVSRLAELYPTDAAVGYALGDLRGAVSVRLGLDGQQMLPVLGPGEMRLESDGLERMPAREPETKPKRTPERTLEG